MDRGHARKIVQQLAHSLNTLDNHSCTRLKPGAGSLIESPMWVVEPQAFEPFPAASQNDH